MVNLDPDKVHRWAVQQQKEAWTLLELPAADSEREAAARGWNILGPELVVEALPREQADRLVDLARRARRKGTDEDATEEAELAALLALVPRRTCPGYDVDVCDEGRAREYSRRILEGEAARGATLRVTYSGPSGRRHLEWGPTAPGAEHVDLLYAGLGRARDNLTRCGFVPLRGASGGESMGALQWVWPDDPDGECGYVDLVPLNHAPGSRQRLFRGLGGLHKDGRTRKRLVPGSALRGSPWSAGAVLEGLRLYAAQVPEKVRPRPERKARAWEPMPLKGKVKPLWRVLRDYAPSDGPTRHRLRLACCGLGLGRELLDREAWVSALTALGSKGGEVAAASAARGAWRSTKARIRGKRAVTGANVVRSILGPAGSLALIDAISRAGRVSVEVALERVGWDRSQEAELDALREEFRERDGEVAEALVRRTDSVAKCGQIIQRRKCLGCWRPRDWCVLTCGWRGACPECAAGRVRLILPELRQAWVASAHRFVVLDATGLATRDASVDYGRRACQLAEFGERPLRLIYPDPRGNGEWGCLLFARFGSQGAARLRGLGMGAKSDRRLEVLSGWAAANRYGIALLARGAAVRERLRRVGAGAAADLAESLYRTHDVLGWQGASVPWVIATAAKELRKARGEAAEAERPPDPEAPKECECATDRPCAYSYEVAATGQEIGAITKSPRPMWEVARALLRLEAGQRAHTVPLRL